MQRRRFLTLSAAAAAGAALPLAARATVPKPYSWDAGPPMDSAVSFIRWMVENRGEEPRYLRARFERFQNMVGHVDLWEARNKRAFLMTPRDEFCLPSDRGVIYDVDPTFANTEEWWRSIPADVRPSKDQPFYHLYAENADHARTPAPKRRHVSPGVSAE